MPEWVAYPSMRDYFLKEDYDYFIIWPDDLVATHMDLQQLIDDCNAKPYEVIGGVCQIDNTTNADMMAVSRRILHPKRNNRARHFETFKEFYDNNGNLWPKWRNNPIIKTRWQGFPLTCISRDVVKLIPFRNDASFNNLPLDMGCCSDDVFCWDCLQNEIEMFTDLRIRCDHLRKDEAAYAMKKENEKPSPYCMIKKRRKGVN